jgi:hypothetical protein
MHDALCFVKFLHPGKEPRPCRLGDLPWNTGKVHTRKFLRARGSWRERPDGPDTNSTDLGFWGEWEPQSTAVPVVERQPNGPAWIHTPYYDPSAVHGWAQNTDPFSFGDQFHFTGCQQHRNGHPTQLAHLKPGSVVLFGSALDYQFVLDTVFVVGDRWIDHTKADHSNRINGTISRAYREVTIEPWYSGDIPRDRVHRLYFGATPDRPVNGMFSFFPSLPIAEVANGFARPVIDIPRVITQSQTQSFQRTFLSSLDDAHSLWRQVIRQVRERGLLLGTHAELPFRREGAAPKQQGAVGVGSCGPVQESCAR